MRDQRWRTDTARRRLDGEIVNQSLVNGNALELDPGVTEALAGYEAWREAFHAGRGTLEWLDGQHYTRDELIRAKVRRVRKLRKVLGGGA
ncbi:MAG: hypothetical protein HC893_00070 [Chloroflexaceae bacterium]|nr:hypothetical protein [Chloroflexaceae bacterium]